MGFAVVMQIDVALDTSVNIQFFEDVCKQIILEVVKHLLGFKVIVETSRLGNFN